VPSVPDDLFEQFLALGYVAPDDLKEMKERSSALGIPLAEVAAIGDARNDIPMLRLAGRSAAMAHARPEVREAADLVVPSNSEEGALEALDRFYPSLAPLAVAAGPATREA